MFWTLRNPKAAPSTSVGRIVRKGGETMAVPQRQNPRTNTYSVAVRITKADSSSEDFQEMNF
jgi:hypothetical protein